MPVKADFATARDQIRTFDQRLAEVFRILAAANDALHQIQVDGTAVSTGAITLDFDGTDFTLTESPTDDFDITINAERIQDIAGAMVTGNVETGIAVTYDDPNGKLDFVLDATLVAFAALTIAADSLTIGTGADAFTQVTFAANTFPAKSSTGNLVAKTITDAALTVLDDTTVGAMVDTLGGAAATGSGGLARATSPVLVTPQIGAATGTSVSLSGTTSLLNTGAAATCGELTLVAGAKTVSTTSATSTCLIFFQRKTVGGTIGFATTYTINAGVSFTVTSDSALDTSVYAWRILETH